MLLHFSAGESSAQSSWKVAFRIQKFCSHCLSSHSCITIRSHQSVLVSWDQKLHSTVFNCCAIALFCFMAWLSDITVFHVVAPVLALEIRQDKACGVCNAHNKSAELSRVHASQAMACVAKPGFQKKDARKYGWFAVDIRGGRNRGRKPSWEVKAMFPFPPAMFYSHEVLQALPKPRCG